MKTYIIEVEETYVATKTYYIDADNMKEAKARAKDADWDDASATVIGNDIKKVKIISANKE